uniref:Transposase n=1 Tax=Heterorhabditis bacteriophora TaxID=37862 RepID=A0A1I7W7F6_HETBA
MGTFRRLTDNLTIDNTSIKSRNAYQLRDETKSYIRIYL